LRPEDGRRLGIAGFALLLFAVMRLLPSPVGLSEAGWAVAAVAAVMAVLWLSEALPLAMTSVLPFLLLPGMGVMKPAEVAGLYWSPIIFLVLGGALVAVAVETHGLHRRLALAIVRRAPASQRGLLFAFMAATALMSMLVSNTATALIMMPVALAVAGSLSAAHPSSGPATDGRAALVAATVLGVAYSANIGGLGTLVGTPTNAISAAIIERSLGIEVSFLTWLAFGLPLVLLAIPIVGVLLVRVFGIPVARLDRAMLADLIGETGPLSPDERRLLPLLGLLLLGWIVLPLLLPVLGLPATDDGIVAMAVALLLFVVPSASGGALLDWQTAKARVPWDILLLFGGGLALAGAITESGLAAWLGQEMQVLAGLNPVLLALIVVAVVVLVTEFASNVAAASAFMPVVAAIAMETGSAPLALVMGAAFAATWGFMMPAGTPPNAIAFATGRVTIGQMVRAGGLVNLLGIGLIVLVCFGVAGLLSPA
jgi:solute carrier family 13 (sodium-dependent dicarboxylate transporter), member 2/3/5